MKTIQYGSLSYLEISNQIRVGEKLYPRHWAYEHAAQVRFYKALGEDLSKLLWKLWRIKKEFLFCLTLMIGFMPHVEKVKAQSLVYHAPYYLQPLSTLQPIQGVSFNIPREVSPIAPPPVVTPVVTVGVTGCGSDPNMAYIYQHESGCRTDAIGPNGPCGLGQALPCSKMGCSLSDWACQDNFFRNYAISRYGSTYNAMLYWQGHSYW